MLYWLVVLVHVIASFILILVVLLQTGKRADLAGAFGGGGSQTAFGARGAATFLSKATTSTAVIFMVTSLGLSILTSQTTGPGGTVLDEVETAPVSAPAETEPGAVLPSAPTDPGAEAPSVPTDPGAEALPAPTDSGDETAPAPQPEDTGG